MDTTTEHGGEEGRQCATQAGLTAEPDYVGGNANAACKRPRCQRCNSAEIGTSVERFISWRLFTNAGWASYPVADASRRTPNAWRIIATMVREAHWTWACFAHPPNGPDSRPRPERGRRGWRGAA